MLFRSCFSGQITKTATKVEFSSTTLQNIVLYKMRVALQCGNVHGAFNNLIGNGVLTGTLEGSKKGVFKITDTRVNWRINL